MQRFHQLARTVARAAGSPLASLAALLLILGWCVAGFIFGFTDTIQLIINTATTIITFLMVFLIQASQNHDTDALNLKLDEIIKSLETARNEFLRAEDMEHDELEQHLQEEKDEHH